MTHQPGLLCLLLSTGLTLAACGKSATTPAKLASPPPYGFLETPNGTTAKGPTFEVQGWVLDAADMSPTVSISIDSELIDGTIQRLARKDVCSANPTVKHCAMGKPGFVLALSTGRFSDGPHTIRFDAANKGGSTTTIATQQFSVKKKTCLVLSVGEARGLAHIGAIDALKEAGIKPDCVAGNSMGAVIGGLYATAPEGELKGQFQKLIGNYKEMSLAEAKRRGALGMIIGGLLTGGLGAIAVGGVAGAVSVEQMDRARFTVALDTAYAHAMIEDLPVPFSTSYQTIEGNGMGPYITAQKGGLATAVSCSANNPVLFKQDLAKAKCLDPGTDRMARIAVDEACKAFRPARIIAVNVTGEPSSSSRQMDCDLKEIMIPASDVTTKAMQGEGPDFEHAYDVGFRTMKDWLATAHLR